MSVKRTVFGIKRFDAKGGIKVAVVKEVPRHCGPRLVWDRTLATHVEPTVALDQSVEANFVDFVRNGFVSPKLKSKITGVRPSEATCRSVDSTTRSVFEVFSVQETVVG